MRGTPETMQNMTDYDDVVSDVTTSFLERSRAAEYEGIPRWMQILDPGIGFANDMRGNLL
jgi:dihydropteroate synthase